MTLIPRTVRALLLAAGLLILAACGDDVTAPASGQPGETDPQSQVDSPVDVAGSDEPLDSGNYVRTESRLDLVSTQPAPILELVLNADGTTVFVRYMGAAEPCSGARVTTTETDTTVEVALVTGLDPNAAAMTCIAQISAYEIAVPLAAPVGERELIAVQPGVAAPADAGNPLDGAVFPTDQYLGLTEAEAMELGQVEQRVVRVARIDDEFFALTEDFSPTRVTIEIEDGIVVMATSG